MTYKDIMRVIPTVHAAQLVNENLETVKKKDMKTKDMVGMGMKNIVGTSFIKLEADMIEGL